MTAGNFSKGRSVDFGLLVMRLGIGFSFVFLHGLPKLMGGPERWTILGRSMNYLDIYFLPGVWGLLAALTEFIGGVLLISGFFTRTGAFFMTCVMIVAAVYHISNGDAISVVTHPIEVGIFLMGITISGPGKISLDYLIHHQINQ